MYFIGAAIPSAATALNNMNQQTPSTDPTIHAMVLVCQLITLIILVLAVLWEVVVRLLKW